MAFRRSRVRSASAPPIKSATLSVSDRIGQSDCPKTVRICQAQALMDHRLAIQNLRWATGRPFVLLPPTRRTVWPAEIATRSSPGWSAVSLTYSSRRVEPVQRAGRNRGSCSASIQPAPVGSRAMSGEINWSGTASPSRMPVIERPPDRSQASSTNAVGALAPRPLPVRPAGEDLTS